MEAWCPVLDSFSSRVPGLKSAPPPGACHPFDLGYSLSEIPRPSACAGLSRQLGSAPPRSRSPNGCPGAPHPATLEMPCEPHVDAALLSPAGSQRGRWGSPFPDARDPPWSLLPGTSRGRPCSTPAPHRAGSPEPGSAAGCLWHGLGVGAWELVLRGSPTVTMRSLGWPWGGSEGIGRYYGLGEWASGLSCWPHGTWGHQGVECGVDFHTVWW